MSSQDQRIASNEALFRDVNERIARFDSPPDDRLEIVCECGDRECVERIVLTPAEYEHARSDPAVFLTKPAHIETAAESVVAERPGYLLVRKTGDAASIAEERDPRS